MIAPPGQEKAPGTGATVHQGKGNIVETIPTRTGQASAGCAVLSISRTGHFCAVSEHTVPEKPGRDVASAAPGRDSGPLVSLPYGEELRGNRVCIYPGGVHLKGDMPRGKPPVGTIRGTIEGFSGKAASRLRAFCVQWEVKERVPWAVTCTIRKSLSVEDFQAAAMRMRSWCRRYDVPVIWRVELQRRGVPHLHCVVWARSADDVAAFRLAWLSATFAEKDPASRKHAVQSRAVYGAGWAVYVALHNGKHKTDQLGWKGKQWGIWCRDRFTPRASEVFQVSDRQRVVFQRILRKLLARVGRHGKRPMRERVLSKGNDWLRCVDGDQVRKLVLWVRGTICTDVGEFSKDEVSRVLSELDDTFCTDEPLVMAISS